MAKLPPRFTVNANDHVILIEWPFSNFVVSKPFVPLIVIEDPEQV